MILPDKDSSLTEIAKSNLCPFPNQLFSLTFKANCPPLVPIPAPALISPVGCSSTSISMIFKFFLDPSIIFDFTSANILLDLILEIDFFRFKSVNGSPSSNKSSPRMTDSFVILFPEMFIRSTRTFSDSKILNFISIVF